MTTSFGISKRTSIIVLLAFITFGFIYSAITSIGPLPKGDYLYSIESPNKDYKLNVYKVYYDSKSGYAIRVEVENVDSGKRENIYWESPASAIEIEWLNNEYVIINEIELNIHNDIYKHNG